LQPKQVLRKYLQKKHTINEVDHEDQSYLPERLRDHSLLIAFAPVDHPKIAIAIISENSGVAATAARKILDYYLLPHQGVKPT